MGTLGRILNLVFQLGYFGPFLMGVLDSSFLILPFGNDLVVVGFAAHHPAGIPGYVASAALGSTCGALLLALVARKLGEEGLRKLTGSSNYEKLKTRIGSRSGIALAIGALSPPPFPYTAVIASVAALRYPLPKLLTINFLARAARFTALALLALKFGPGILSVGQSSPFRWSIAAFTALCLVASGFSIARWLRKPQPRSSAA